MGWVGLNPNLHSINKLLPILKRSSPAVIQSNQGKLDYLGLKFYRIHEIRPIHLENSAWTGLNYTKKNSRAFGVGRPDSIGRGKKNLLGFRLNKPSYDWFFWLCWSNSTNYITFWVQTSKQALTGSKTWIQDASFVPKEWIFCFHDINHSIILCTDLKALWILSSLCL